MSEQSWLSNRPGVDGPGGGMRRGGDRMSPAAATKSTDFKPRYSERTRGAGGGSIVGGPQLGLAHSYATARHREFVAEASKYRVPRSADSRTGRRLGGIVVALRGFIGQALIGLGERIRGADKEKLRVPSAPGLRIAR